MNKLYKHLDEMGLLDYGSVFEGEVVRDILGITMPEYGTKADFDAVALAELQAVDAVRSALLGQGKYLGADRSAYRVFLPSENKGVVESYMHQADRKLRRAMKLSRTMPVQSEDGRFADQIAARLHLKQQQVRKFQDRPGEANA